MKTFLDTIEQQFAAFLPYSNYRVSVPEALFERSQGEMREFVAELQETAKRLVQQRDSLYAELYAKRLILQFDALQKALDKLQAADQDKPFQSSYRFARNIHQLPVEKRLMEYKKALRALNEKLSWLTEQSYQCNDEAQRQDYIAQIQETEYRKQKCLQAIEALE
ncbi:primosomal replication protein N [Muribacter muris]|uniref:Primosomal replication protein N n=1 Tax=Muribacter muris TaxID=67855 RepID=A0A4Y9K659_9PAST|nr:primosomal replication protein PriC [Muribacter muris]MBF0784337.1 primosomal replication protein [Muribacter muris]MBF0827883.1 primosomal replication protein [Muribacter muris]TFV12115.1 primosomal replication protein N [Muribacter muris]